MMEKSRILQIILASFCESETVMDPSVQSRAQEDEVELRDAS